MRERLGHWGATIVGWIGLLLLGIAIVLFMLADQFEEP